jgi:hypothetical protein
MQIVQMMRGEEGIGAVRRDICANANKKNEKENAYVI